MLRGYWLVADMDGTLVPTPSKAGGHYLPLSSSPCYGPICRFLELGGSVCVVSTAGKRMWRQVFDVLRPTLQGIHSSRRGGGGTLAICGMSGAAMFLSSVASPSSGGGTISTDAVDDEIPAVEMVERVEYRKNAIPGGTCVEGKHHDAALALCAGVVRKFIREAVLSTSPSSSSQSASTMLSPLVAKLSRKYHAPYSDLVNTVRGHFKTDTGSDGLSDRHHDHDEAAISMKDLDMFLEEELLPVSNCIEYGRYLTATNDALVDCQVIPTATAATAFSSVEAGDREVEEKKVAAIVAQYTVLGIPMAEYDRFFTKEIIAQFGELGLQCKKQPNSVVVARQGIDKATCVKWLMENKPSGFCLEKSIALGDIPSSIDLPLTRFPPMPFVSLSVTPETDPDTVSFYVGGEEEGTARFLEALLEHHHHQSVLCSEKEEVIDHSKDDTSNNLFAPAVLEECVAKATRAPTGETCR